MSTIYAVSSGRPPAAIAVIRISGPEALAAAKALAGSLPEPRRAALRLLSDDEGGALDRALVLVFPAPRSATGEDLVELHCHGGRAVVAAVERALGSLPGCRPAESGEFTRRALENSRIDLAEAEGLADLLEAETEAQRIAALGAAEGQISRQVSDWLAKVVDLSARIEAVLDHADEGDVDIDDRVIARIAEEAEALGRGIAEAAAGPPVERLRDGVRVVIAGPPNAGKSTLFNLLAEREAAIVSPVAGTTRDRIEAGVVRHGAAYTLLDTAGLTDTEDVVEAMGVARAGEAIATADLLLWLGDDPPPRADALWIQAQVDLPGREVLRVGRIAAVRYDDPNSIEVVWSFVETSALALMPRTDALPLRRRHRALCVDAVDALMDTSRDPILLAERLRTARYQLAQITGADATETMLDALFSRFCIGK